MRANRGLGGWDEKLFPAFEFAFSAQSKRGGFVGGSNGLNSPARIHMVAIVSVMVAAATGGVAAGH